LPPRPSICAIAGARWQHRLPVGVVSNSQPFVTRRPFQKCCAVEDPVRPVETVVAVFGPWFSISLAQIHFASRFAIVSGSMGLAGSRPFWPEAALTIARHGIGCQRYNHDSRVQSSGRGIANPAGCLISIDFRHLAVHEHKILIEMLQSLYRLSAVENQIRRKTQTAQDMKR
jgi:hypothetical protein